MISGLRLAFVLMAFALPAHADALDELMQRLAQVKSARGKFVERKQLAMLQTPLESSGTLYYVAPGRLEKHMLKPRRESMILDGDTLILEFSEFGRRVFENGSQGTDHGAGAVMMAIGGAVRGGIYGTSPNLDPNSPTLENNGGDVRYETDFRSVYARVLDNWLGASSVPILGGDFRAGAPPIV